MTKRTLSEILREIYYDASHPAGYRGPIEVLRHAKKQRPQTTLRDVKAWLASEDTHTLHRPVRRRYRRNRVYVNGIDDQWQADLVDVAALSRHNRGIRFLLTCIDIFSKYAWVLPVKDKRGPTIAKALDDILRERTPRKLQTDKGSEFFNKDVKKCYDPTTFTFLQRIMKPKRASSKGLTVRSKKKCGNISQLVIR